MSKRTVQTLGGYAVWQPAPEHRPHEENPDIRWQYPLGTPFERVTWQNFSSTLYRVIARDRAFELVPVEDHRDNRNIYTFAKYSNIASESRNAMGDLSLAAVHALTNFQVYVAVYGPPRHSTIYRIPIGGDEP